jgi:hypothetical protein
VRRERLERKRKRRKRISTGIVETENVIGCDKV